MKEKKNWRANCQQREILNIWNKTRTIQKLGKKGIKMLKRNSNIDKSTNFSTILTSRSESCTTIERESLKTIRGKHGATK